MNFYNALQLDPAVLKGNFAAAETKHEQRKWLSALVVRDILLVLFAIVFVTTLSELFGSENSSMAVVIFCILLSVRMVDFGYNIRHSLCSLSILFLLLWISPWLQHQVPAGFGLVINFFSLLLIVVLACENPEMGNGGLYLFGYIFLTGSYVTYPAMLARGLLTLIGFVICAGVLIRNHRHKHTDVTLRHVVGHFQLSNSKSQWQLQLALGVSILLFLGSVIHMERFVWAGFACSSLLSTYPVRVKERLWERVSGVVLGSALFGIVAVLIPASWLFLLGPISGLCLGLCATYRYKTVFNCFGALSLATTIYGLGGSILLRVCNNILGILFGVAFFHFFRQGFWTRPVMKSSPPVSSD